MLSSGLVLVVASLKHGFIAHPVNQMVLSGVAVMLLLVTAIFSPTWLSGLDRNPSGFRMDSLFIRPVTTRQMTGIPFLFALLTSVLIYLFPALLFSATLRVWLPISGPLWVLVITISACFVAVTGLTRISERAVACLLIAASLLWLMFRRLEAIPDELPVLLALGDPRHWHVGPIAWFAAVAFSLSCWGLCDLSVSRQRCGESVSIIDFLGKRFRGGGTDETGRATSTAMRETGWRSQTIEAHHRSASSPTLASVAKFRARARSQLRFEFARAAPSVLAIAAALPLIAVGFAWLGSHCYPNRPLPAEAWWATIPVTGLLAILVAVDRLMQLSRFEATRPLRNDHFAYLKGVTAAVFAVLAMGAMSVTVFVATRWITPREPSQVFLDVLRGLMSEQTWSGRLLGGTSIAFGLLQLYGWLTGMIWIMQRPRLALSLLWAAALSVLVVVWASSTSGWPSWAWESLAVALSVPLAAASILFLAWQVRRRQIQAAIILGVLILWSGSVFSGWFVLEELTRVTTWHPSPLHWIGIVSSAIISLAVALLPPQVLTSLRAQ